MILKKLWQKPAVPVEASVPAGIRVYAIGDIHGRLDLLDALLAQIDSDDASREPADTQLIFLGDLIDRGPASAGVVDRLLRLSRERPSVSVLMGNHEEVCLAAIGGDLRALRMFCRIGGRDTVLSYGIDADAYERMDYDELLDAFAAAVPADHKDFMRGFGDSVVIGDYLFVHAGVSPSLPLDAQKTSDLRWIREPFLEYRGRLDKIVVHGHTIRPDVEWRTHRIGIDTGAYETGQLTALGLEGTDRWVLQT